MSVLRNLICLLAFLSGASLVAQSLSISGIVIDESGQPITDAVLILRPQERIYRTADDGRYLFKNLSNGTFQLTCFASGKKVNVLNFNCEGKALEQNIVLSNLESNLDAYEINQTREDSFGIARLRAVHDFAIYEGKKSEVVQLNGNTANLATNNPRQVYSKVTGLNIWESDGAGLQLGIGGRGLNPNRTASFNVRQNGYDISADALGYPEAYYTPPAEALETVEIVRGAASLQYGTQFGGLLNFRFKRGPYDRKIAINSRFTAGSWGFINAFNSVGGTLAGGRLNYYGFMQYKRGNGYRVNSGFEQVNAFAGVTYDLNNNWKVQADFTKMHYLAQQAGGLTDKTFEQDPRQSFRNRNWFLVDWNLAAIQFNHRFSESTELNIRTFGLMASRSSVGNLERINVADLGGNRTLIEGEFENIGNETRLIHRYTLGKQLNILAAGIRLYQGKTFSRQGLGSAGSDANFEYINAGEPENSDYIFPSKNAAAFLEHIFRISNRFSVTPGLRAEIIQTAASGYYKSYVYDAAGNLVSQLRTDENSLRKRKFLLAGVGISYKTRWNSEMYANISQNYRAINFSDLRIVNPNFIVDPNIRDEKGYTADWGIRGKIRSRLHYELTAFYIAYRGKIGQVLKTGQAPLYTNIRFRSNIADARNVGIESYCEWNVIKPDSVFRKPALSLFANTAFVDARYVNTNDKSILNRYVEMVPRFIFRTGAEMRWRKWNLHILHAYTGEHFSDATNAVLTATAVEGLIPAYRVADAGIGYAFRWFNIQVNVNNAFNEQYFTRRSESYPGPGILPADGRAFYCTLQINL